jgi:CMP-N,N'-diacetyllegionaminic acid synthase
VVSVVAVPHNFRPDKLLEVEDGRVVSQGAGDLQRGGAPLYARNGPAVLVLRTAGFPDRGLYGGDVRAYEMLPEESLDVDEPADLELARILLGRRVP